MKYGLLVNENNSNLGDDIQAYAESRFLPRVDMIVDREHLDTFQYGDGTEPVALIMGAWFMWRKFNWPPARQIIPLNIGYHHFDRNPKVLESSSYAVPIFHEHYSGVGGQWFKEYGPVGCRDLYTKGVLDEQGIPNYFSGCVTLTLPKQPETPDKDTYIVCVDLNAQVEEKVRALVGDRYEVRNLTHKTENIKGATWEERVERVKKHLTVYQNAKYVVTRRLHVALPCLAMGTPVMVIQSVGMNDPNRFEPYRDWLHYCRNNDFLKNGYDGFDFQNGTPNGTEYLQYRESLSKTMTDFAQYCEENKDKPLDFFVKTTYTDDECNAWRSRFLADAMAATHKESKKMQVAYKNLAAKHQELKLKNEELKAKNADMKAQRDEWKEKYKALEAQTLRGMVRRARRKLSN